jgi:1-acyl-sn-glycerol-3-phosphate acyltransferase
MSQKSPSFYLSLLFWPFFTITGIFWWTIAFVIWILTIPFDKKRVVLHLFTCFWAFHYFKLMPLWKITITGREHIENGKPYILVANHQSMMDIFISFGMFKHFKWVAKRSLFAIPFIGWNMYMNNHVGLIRGMGKSVKKMYADCNFHLTQGSPIFIFPEGTRSKDGEIGKFKKGAFKIAINNEVPIIPITIDGTRDAMEKDSWVVNIAKRIHVTIDILPKIEPSEYDNDDQKMMIAAETAIRDRLSEIRNRV